MTYLIIQVPDDLHRQFKTLCTQRGKNMKDTIISMIKDHIKFKDGGDI